MGFCEIAYFTVLPYVIVFLNQDCYETWYRGKRKRKRKRKEEEEVEDSQDIRRNENFLIH